MNSNSSKRIVITTWGSFGDLRPYMAIALELKSRGHHPVIATSLFYREKIEAAGIGFHPMRPDMPPRNSAESLEMVRRALDVQEGPRYVFRDVLMRHVRVSYEDALAAVSAEGGADLLLSHTIPTIAPIIAEQTGIRWVSTVLAPIAFCSAYDPPTLPQFPLSRKLLTVHPTVAKAIITLGKRSTLSWSQPVRELRRQLGLPPGQNPIFEGQHSPTRVLGLFSTVLAKVQPDFPPHTTFTGFPFYDCKDQQPPALELRRFLDAGEPPIVFTLGSSAVWNAGDFYRTSIAAVERLNERALLLIGDAKNLPSTALPESIAAFDYAPHSLVMPRAKIIVHQGGIGTTGQALRSGRPMLIVPYGQDQPDNARRCTELGVGRTIARHCYTLPNAVKELSELLTNPAYTARAEATGRKVRAENGASAACDAIIKIAD